MLTKQFYTKLFIYNTVVLGADHGMLGPDTHVALQPHFHGCKHCQSSAVGSIGVPGVTIALIAPAEPR